MLGVYKPDSGAVHFSHNAKHVGLASQKYAFYPRLSVLENLSYYGTMYGMKNSVITKRSKELLELFELYHARNTRCENLSGGMQRRLDMAIALIHSPKILILDEPTTGLDVVLKEKMWDLIQKIKSDGVTIIISSHDLDEMQDNCDEAVFIHDHCVINQKQLAKYLSKYSLEDLFRGWYLERT